MSYTVLARKYRSRTLDEIVGQQPIVTTLTNAIKSGRIHHAFLFCGTRGVGKTSTARVLAKSLNCLQADEPTVTPCCQCDCCQAIAEGEDLDVIEIDAASNTGVDHIRDLRSNVAYRPARARYKIYIIDEVHMLSTGAFNALLKTLEEPPSHVKFIFATTELHKVPATIQSRVQRFEFQSIAAQVIAEHLHKILQAEGLEADDAVVRRVARCADGSLRDALSLLDQLLSLGADRLDVQLVDEILPAEHDERFSELITHLAGNDAAQALLAADRVLAGGQTLERFCEHMITHLRSLMVVQICGPQSELVDVPAASQDQVLTQSQSFDAQTYVYMITVLEELRRQVRSSAAGRALLDAAVVRLASAQNFSAIPELLDRLSATGAKKKVIPKPEVARTAAAPGTGRPAAAENQARSQTRDRASQATSPARAGAQNSGSGQAKPSGGEMAAVRSDPLVRAALQRFDGTLINVQKVAGAQPDSVETPARTDVQGEE